MNKEQISEYQSLLKNLVDTVFTHQETLSDKTLDSAYDAAKNLAYFYDRYTITSSFASKVNSWRNKMSDEHHWLKLETTKNENEKQHDVYIRSDRIKQITDMGNYRIIWNGRGGTNVVEPALQILMAMGVDACVKANEIAVGESNDK